MIHYNNDNNAHCSTVNSRNFDTIEPNKILISALIHRKLIFLITF